MKRDMALIKTVLEHIESSKPIGAHGSSSFWEALNITEANDEWFIALEHINLLYMEGYIFGDNPPSIGADRNIINPDSINIRGLTWKGYDLLDSLREKP